MIVQTLCTFLVLIAIFLLAFNLEVTELGIASNLNAVMIVFGGTFLATLLAYPLSKLVMTARFIRLSFKREDAIDGTIQTIVKLARIYKKDGIRALERECDHLPPGLIRTGVGLIAYRFNKENIEQLLHKEALSDYGQYETAYKILCNMAKLAPAMGLAGTVVNLIRTFGHINIANPQHLIGYMAVALLSTFYGVVLANLVFVPLSNKLREFMDEDLLRMEIIKEGILDIYDQEHPRAIQYKLETLTGVQLEPYPPHLAIVETPFHASHGR